MKPPDWWKKLPCHLNPEWKLHETSEIDVESKKNRAKLFLRTFPDFMTVENLLYQAFLEVIPTGQGFVRKKLVNRQAALRLIQEAEKYINCKMKDNSHAQTGYGVVINSFRMWIYTQLGYSAKLDEVEKILLDLDDAYQDDPKAKAFSNVTLAFALSKLGYQKYEKVKELFEDALVEFSASTQWMFGKAMMQGRIARHRKNIVHQSSSLPDDIKRLLEEEKVTLLKVTEKDSTFALPFAHLGLCCYNLGEKEAAIEYIEKAYNLKPRSTDVALFRSRILKWNGDLDGCRKVLNDLPRKSKTAEVMFQLALNHNERAKIFCEERTDLDSSTLTMEEKKEYNEYLKNALECVQATLTKDSCHFPAEIKHAELTARLGYCERARDLYLNLFVREDVKQLPLNEFKARQSANLFGVRYIFEETQVIDNIHKMLELCNRNFVTFDNEGLGTFEESVEKMANNLLKELTKRINSEDPDEDSLLATLILAEAKRELGNYKEAEQLIEGLIQKKHPKLSDEEVQNNWIQNNEVRLQWNLGKCYVDLHNFDEAETVCNLLECFPPKRQFSASELRSYLCLTKAQKYLRGRSDISDASPDYSVIVGQLKEAICKGSIKACYWYLTKVQKLQERLCSFEDNIMETIIHIETCLERGQFYHTNFDDCPNDIVGWIKERIKCILEHPKVETTASKNIKRRYTTLTELRWKLHSFQGCYLQLDFSNKRWNEVCEDKARMVLSLARKLLDFIIFDYQMIVQRPQRQQSITSKPGHTNFPIFFNPINLEVDQNKNDRMFDRYVRKTFPNYKMPYQIASFLKQIQPYYSAENRWLAVFNDYANREKHHGNEDHNDIYSFNQVKQFQKVDLVRKSCFKIEQIVDQLLTFIANLSQYEEV